MIKKDCIHCVNCEWGGYLCKITGEMDEDMTCSKCKHYHKPMIFYVDELPNSCGEQDCPFNYDTFSCQAKTFAEGGSYKSKDRELEECLDENGKRYSKCPLRLISKLKKDFIKNK